MKENQYYDKGDLGFEYLVISALSALIGLIVYEVHCYTHAKEWYGYILWGLAGLGLGLCIGLLLIAFLYISGIKSVRNFSWIGWSLLSSLFIFISLYTILPHAILNIHNKKCDCINVDDCISKYCFEEARNYASNESRSDISFDFAKIIKSEATYWLGEKDVKRALNVSSELLSLETIDKPNEEIHTAWDSDNDLKKVDGFTIGIKNTCYSELLFNIIKAQIGNKQFETIIELTKMFPEYNETNDDECNKIKSKCYIYIIQKLCQDEELKKANEILEYLPVRMKISTRYYKMPLENGLFNNVAEDDLKAQEVYKEFASKFAEDNEEIEPFKGNGKWHKVFKILNLKDEAKAIISEYGRGRSQNK